MTNENYLAKIAVGKSLLKEYSNSCGERIVYMDNDTEFQIQIFNPYTYTIGVTFSFNGDYDGNGQKLVVRPGERIWLDRYLDNESRLLFSTYEVESDNEVKNAIKNNGEICIQFFSEMKKREFNSALKLAKPTQYDNIWYTRNDDNHVYCYYNANMNTNTTSDITLNTGASYDTVLSVTNGMICEETGRIEEGNTSYQKFESIYKEFAPIAFKTEYIKILPMSQKQINANDLAKKYCHECGRKLNQKFKYCPYCGAKL